MKFGTTDIQDLKLGSTPIVEVRRGTELIWPDASGTNAFIITVQTDNSGTSGTNQFTIPTNGTGYDYTVNTSDGQTLSNNTGDLTITFPAAGTYDVEITGLFPTIYFNKAGDRLKLIDIKQWGNIEWSSLESSFWGCNNLIGTFTDKPNTANVTSLYRVFRECTNFNPSSVSGWDTSNVTNMGEVFMECRNFNCHIDWDTSSAYNMGSMFRFAMMFNQDVSSFDTSNVTNMYTMFYYASNFNQDVSSWNIEKVDSLGGFLAGVNSYSYLDNIYSSWSGQNVLSNVQANFGSATYTSAGLAGRDDLINNHGWTITDGGQV